MDTILRKQQWPLFCFRREYMLVYRYYKVKMVKYCVICGNVEALVEERVVSLHNFPKNQELATKWAKFGLFSLTKSAHFVANS